MPKRTSGCLKNPYAGSLAHTTWECEYHIVFALKFRRKEIYGTLKRKIGMILIRELCRKKEIEVINAEACPDHIHMYVSIASKVSVSSFVDYLNGKSTLIIFEKYKYSNRTFGCRGFYVGMVGNNKSAVYNYVVNQLKEDMISDQITIKEYRAPFKGE